MIPRLALIACMLVGCGDDDAPRDGGRDASPDASRDASSDAGPSAGLDAGRDASSDAGAALEPDPTCASPGCLRAATDLGDFARGFLEPLLDPGVSIDNGYSVWTLRYATTDRESLATVTIPYMVAPPAGGFHVVGNNHGTSGVEDACAFAGNEFGAGLAGLFGARGMIGVAPDYPGIGTEGVHPYLVADVEAHAALDALRAATQLARWLRIPLSGRYAMVGLSQGGHVTLSAAARHRELAPELDVRAFGVAAPASVFVEHWSAGAAFDGPHLSFHAMLFYAWSAHYGYDGPAVFATDLATRIDDVMATRCSFAFRGREAIGDAIGERADGIFDAGFLAAYRARDWGPWAPFDGWFEANRVRPYDQSAPLRVYQGDADPVIPEPATAELVADLRAGGVELDYEVVPGGTHVDVAFGFVASDELRTVESVAWIRSRLDAP